MTHPCECDLTDDHGEAAELRRRLEARDHSGAVNKMVSCDLISNAMALCREFRVLPHGDLPADPWEAMRHTCDALEKAIASLTAHPVAHEPVASMRSAAVSIEAMCAEWYASQHLAHLPADLIEKRLSRFVAAPAQPVGQEPVAAAPERVWMGAADADGDHEFWFDPDEGGTEYIRADLAHPATPAPVEAGLRSIIAANQNVIDGLMAELTALRAQSAPVGETERPYILRLPVTGGVCIGGRWHGWFMRQHPDGQWVTVAKLTSVDPFPVGGEGGAA